MDGRDRLPAHAVIAVAARHVVAIDAFASPVLRIGDVGALGGQLVQRNIDRLVDHLAARRVARRIEILGDRRLPIGHHPLAGMFPRIDEEAGAPRPGDGRPVMRVAFAVHALAQSHRAQQLDRARLQHAGADPPQHVRTALPLQHDRVDPLAIEHVGEQQPGRPAADDRHLGAHDITARRGDPCGRPPRGIVAGDHEGRPSFGARRTKRAPSASG